MALSRISSKITLLTTIECQRPATRRYARYASAPNDIWSLGVILVNLTCGRNPWKKASPEDSTFRAYLKDPQFLSTILPISAELNVILRRVFECDPQQRISLAELRDLIVACPRLTTSSYSTVPPSPPASPSPPAFASQGSEWSLFEPASKQESTCSSNSTDSGYESEASYRQSPTCCPPVFNFYGNVIPYSDGIDKPLYPPANFTTHPVIAF